MRFQKSGKSRLTEESARRQSDITRLAMQVLGREAAIEFMNDISASLGGRPIDLAVASEDGLALAKAELERMKSTTSAMHLSRQGH